MDQLFEIPDVKQRAREPRRRWFQSEKLELIVWFDKSDRKIGFQFCYDKPRNEHALTWTDDDGYSHMAIDNGERGVRSLSPILAPSGPVDEIRILELFTASSSNIPEDIKRFVVGKIESFPNDANIKRHPWPEVGSRIAVRQALAVLAGFCLLVGGYCLEYLLSWPGAFYPSVVFGFVVGIGGAICVSRRFVQTFPCPRCGSHSLRKKVEASDWGDLVCDCCRTTWDLGKRKPFGI